jgi:hypothetical protein
LPGAQVAKLFQQNADQLARLTGEKLSTGRNGLETKLSKDGSELLRLRDRGAGLFLAALQAEMHPGLTAQTHHAD